MYAFGSVLINRAYKVLINALGHKRYHGCRRERGGEKRLIKHKISRLFILGHSLHPITLSAAADVPVTHFVNKCVKRASRLGYPVIGKVIVNRFYH